MQLQPRRRANHVETGDKKQVSTEEHIAAAEGVGCLKDQSVIDETPAAYIPIEQMMQAQSGLVKIMHISKQMVCIKG